MALKFVGALYPPDNQVVGQVNGRMTTATTTSGTQVVRNIIISTSAPTSSDGSNGDVWFRYA